LTCRRSFSTQTFSVTYWLKQPQFLRALFRRVMSCSSYRQIAREFKLAPTTVMRQTERLGRHCLLFQEQFRLRARPFEALVVDGFESFEYSQYFPLHFHLAVGAESHFLYAFTDSELRRKGRMTPRQKRRRAKLERELGRPDPRSIEKEMANLVDLMPFPHTHPRIFSDDHPAYPRALRRLPHLAPDHRTVSSLKPRIPQNPLFPVIPSEGRTPPRRGRFRWEGHTGSNALIKEKNHERRELRRENTNFKAQGKN
jgi:hypothetical protein